MQQVVQEHGGTVRCESEPGRGTTFTIAPAGGARGARRAGARGARRGGARAGPRPLGARPRGAGVSGRARARPRGAPGPGWGRLERGLLDNGLRVLTAPTPGLHSAMIGLYVRTGSRHETAASNGVSHLLEHLFFRGSKGWPDSVAMNAAVEAVGGNLNGVTARDHGCYYTPIHPDELEVGLRIVGDLVTRPLLTGLEVEREIILEEILDEVDPDGRDIDPDNLVKRLVFPGHPLGFKIAGTRDTVRALTMRQVRRHLARHYTGANMVLAVAGPVRHAQVLELAARHLGALPRGERSRRPPAPALAGGADPRGGGARRRPGRVHPGLPLPARAPPRLPGLPLPAPHPRRRPLLAPALRGGGEARPGLLAPLPASTPSATPACWWWTPPARRARCRRWCGRSRRCWRGWPRGRCPRPSSCGCSGATA